ncbi:MAG: hypothetical protein ABI818_19480 [Acidobacteriota bacterium]
MTPLLLIALSIPCIYWTDGADSRAKLDAAGISRICVPAGQADPWRDTGLTVTAVTPSELASREALPAPGVTARAGVASPTRSPWIIANGWRFMRRAGGRYLSDAPAGKAALAAAEAFMYGADVMLKIDPADLETLAAMLKFLQTLPAADLPPVADLGVVDDGSALTGEAMNLLARRNLLFQVVPSPAAQFRLNIVLGSPAYPLADAADPSAFALKVRRQLGDEERSVRIYGSEVVICRLTGDAGRVRLHLLNYGGREIEGLHVRLRGAYRDGQLYTSAAGRLPLDDFAVAGGDTEFSVPKLETYAVIDLQRAR